MDRLSSDNPARAEPARWTWLGNLRHACQTSRVDTRARAERIRFQRLLDEQRDVRGVRELSLAGAPAVTEPGAPQPAHRAASAAWTHRATHLPASPSNRATRSPSLARSGESSR